MKSINVLIITYNQQEVIGRALDSIIAQKDDGLNRIIISDDCSSDNNCDVIRNYADRFPNLIELHRNNKNLGIYGNAEQLLIYRGDADLYLIMAGDDAICDGWFRAVQDYIRKNQILLDSVSGAFYSDWKSISPTGEEKVYNQSIIADPRCNPQSLRLRGLISMRSVLATHELMNRHIPIPQSLSTSRAESLFDNQFVDNSDINFYVNYVGSIYFSRIGFSKKTHSKEYQKEILSNKQETLYSRSWDKQDRAFLLYSISLTQMEIQPRVSSFIRAMWFYMLGQKKGYPSKVQSFFKYFGSIFFHYFIRHRGKNE